jgi:WD40 repeat protein
VTLRNRFKQVVWPLLWLAGVALLVYYAPLRYHTLSLADGEQVIDFLGPSHELITAVGHPRRDEDKNAVASSSRVPPVYPRRMRQTAARLDKSVLGNSVRLWNVNTDTRRELALGAGLEIFGVTPSGEGNRIFVEYRLNSHRTSGIGDTGCRIAAFDAETGALLRTVKSSEPCALASISDDGRVLAYRATPNMVSCLDVDSGRELYSPVASSHAIVSPNGKYLATCSFTDQAKTALEATVIDLDQRRRVDARPHALPEGFSLQSDKLIYERDDFTKGDLWHIPSRKVVRPVPTDCIFVNDDEGLAWIDNLDGGLIVKLIDIAGALDVPAWTIWIPEWPGTIEPVDRHGYVISVEAAPLSPQVTWVQQVLSSLGFKQSPLQQWLLLDARSGHVLDRGRDELIAVSADGRYVVSGDHDQTRLKLHELPLHGSATFIGIAGAVWTMFVLVCRRWWIHRLKPPVTDAIEPGPATV